MAQYIPTKRPKDMKEEQWLGAYLDKNVYPIIEAANHVRFQRNSDTAKQLLGIDLVRTDSDGTETIIDEKAQLHYVWNHISTCAFELRSVQQGRLLGGWFYDPGALAQVYYYAVNIDVKAGVSKLTSPNDFAGCQILSIDRAALIAALAKMNITEDRCITFVNEHPGGKWYDLTDEGDIHITASPKLNESPLNLVIERRTLLRLDPDNIKWIWNAP